MSTKLRFIFDLHQHQLENYPKSDCLTAKINGKWESYSIHEFLDTANQLSLGLLKLGLKKGDKIGIVSNNRPEWHICDLAMLQIGIINVPIYPTITEKDYEYILNEAEVKLVFVSDEDLFEKLNNVKASVGSLDYIYAFNELSDCASWKTLLEDASDITEINNIKSTLVPEELATLIYTSGTTGNPKGVMLSHTNLVENVIASRKRLPCDEHSKGLSFLPLCHVLERMVTYMYIYTGVSIYYAESLENIGENLKEIKPQLFTTVPRLLEKIYDKIVAKGRELTGLKRALFFWALDLGLEYDVKGKSLLYKFQLFIANKIIFNKWREALGNNCLAVASGSAALQPRLARVFLAAQIPIMEGYGLTETSPVIAVNCAENDGVRIGTVGRPIENVEVKIAEDGEILVKGPNVMIGYYKNESATKEAFNEDGFLHTGDIGEIVEGQYLRITDRKKEMFKTSGGKYIAPQVMENKLKESLFIEQIMVIGENRKHTSALIQPAFEILLEWCKRNNIETSSMEDILNNELVISRFQKEIDNYNETFAQFEQIKQFRLTPNLWTVDAGELTPTLKLRRKIILEKYKTQINDIYGNPEGED